MVKSWKIFRKNTYAMFFSFESYFVPNFDFDDYPTENNPDEKLSRERRQVNASK